MSTEWAVRDRLLAALTRASASVALLRGPDLVYEYANELYCRLARINLDPVGKPFGLSPRPDEVQRMRALLERVYASGESFTARELDVKFDEGSESQYFNVTFEPTRDGSGQVDGILIHGIDVTSVVLARRQLEVQGEQVRLSEEKLRSVVEGAPVALFALDASFRFTAALGRGLGLIGLREEDLLGARADELFPQHMAYAERALQGEEVVVILEQGGRDIEARVTPRRDPGGAIVGIVAVTIDVTERVRAEREHEKLQAQLVQVQKLESLGVLAGGIAHDFNNLLTAILGGASTASLLLPPENPAQEPLGDTVLAARRAADLTRQLLAYSGKGHFDVRPIDLSALVREIGRLLEASVPKHVQLRLELAQSLPAIEADVVQIQQVVMNLVINGAEAVGGENGTVLVTTATQDIDEASAAGVFAADGISPGPHVYLEVHDSGSGMDEATRAKIFDPFFTTKFTGRGLGLAAVLGIVRAHRGAIRVYSTVGRGSTFKILFPASTEPAVTRRDSQLDAYRGTGQVLVIDDDSGVRTAVRRQLEIFGFEVVAAGGGREALSMLGSHPGLRLVILDMTMPEMSGEETFRELRRVRPGVPVILSSGYNEIEATRRFVSKGLAGFLQKPFTTKDLARCIAAALDDGHRAED